MENAKQSDWKSEPLPKKTTTVRLDRSFSSSEMERIRRGVVPEQMEDKWFVYWQEGALHFHRSWTGFCIYVVRFENTEDGCAMKSADLNRDDEQYGETSADMDIEMISKLIDLLLLRRDSELPIDESDPSMRALKKWGVVGRAMIGEHPDGE